MLNSNRIMNKFLIGLLAAGYLTMSLSVVCYAGPSGDASLASPANNGPGMWLMMFKVLGSLALILTLFYIIVRFLAKKNQMFQRQKSIKTIGGVMLGQNKSIHMVQVGSKLYLIGVGNDITLIDKIDDPLEIDAITEPSQANTGQFGKTNWIEQWKNRMKDSRATHSQESEGELNEKFQEVFYEKLKKISRRDSQFDRMMDNDEQEDSKEEASRDKI